MLRGILPLFLALLLLPGFAAAEESRIEVSVLSNGAKFIGDKTGGAQIAVVDDNTGEVLAKGITRGGTGSTEKIMGAQGGIYKDTSSDGDAAFTATFDLDRPRKVTIAATGPLAFPQASSTATRTAWLIPGQHLEGRNRVVITLSGYIIEAVETAINQMGTGRASFDLQMLCGCPIQPGGRWDADRINKQATLTGPTGIAQTVELEYSGKGTIYEARFAGQVKHPRSLRVDLLGMDDGNTASFEIPLFQ